MIVDPPEYLDAELVPIWREVVEHLPPTRKINPVRLEAYCAQISTLRKACLVILPAAAPTILTGMRISMGIAWLVIVAAEMLVGGTGIGYFVWNEWNNLSLTNVIFAILVIGVVGMLLDLAFGQLQKVVTYVE